MGNCKYCGKSAGLLKSEHIECAEKYQNGCKLMIEAAKETALGRIDKETLQDTLSGIAAESYISTSNIKLSLIEGFSNAVEQSLEDGILTKQEENSLVEYKNQFSLTQDELDSRNGSYSRLAKAATLRDVLEGKIPERVKVQGQLPFNFQKDEKLVWLFTGVDYFEQRISTHFEGGSQGVSIRVAKGVYYRVGAFRGNPVKTTETILADRGFLAITNKHIYFSGSTKKFRVQYNQIMEFSPYDDGIGIQKDSASAKPQVFKTGDGWFTYNLVVNLSKM